MTKTRELAFLLPEYADAALIISNSNRHYFTGFESSLGYLLVTKKETYLFVDFRYAEAARKIAKNCKVIEFSKFADRLKEVVATEAIHVLMLEGSAFTINDVNAVEDILKLTHTSTIKNDELDKIIARMRIVKEKEEIEKMKTAQKLTEEAYLDTLKLIKEGVTERELALHLEMHMRKNGARGVAFDLIVISGEKTSMPHGVPSDNKIKNGDFIAFDIGADFDGYKSDMTRTVALGEVSDYQIKVYETVQKAQQAALDAIKDGVPCGKVDDAARSIINNAGFEGTFGHATGHGVGLDIHEKPSVSPKSQFVLHSGMVITAEPGIYLAGQFGVRIEDMVLVTKSGFENFATLSKDLLVL